MNYALTVALASTLLLSGCAQPPTDKLAAAEKAVSEAREAGAPSYLPEDFAKLEGMLTNAKSEIAAQDSKFAPLRDYGKAEQLLATAQADGGRVIAETAKKKEEAKAAALQAQQSAKEAVSRAQALVAKAPAGKERAALEAIKADAQALTNSLNDVQAAMDAGDYLAAQNKAKAIQEKASALGAEVQTALAKVEAARKGKVAKK
jgi:hypothetical protein